MTTIQSTAPSDNRYFNPTVAGACDVIEILAGNPLPISVSEIANQTHLTRATALRVMRTLASKGMAKDIGHAKYIAGPRLIATGLHLTNHTTCAAAVHPYLQQLTEQTGETSHFAMLIDDKTMIVDVCDCDNALRVASRPGTEVHMHAAATSKAILSLLPPDQQQDICNQLKFEKLTANTLENTQDLLLHLKQVQTHGYAIDDEEYFLGVRCLAAPVSLGPGDNPTYGAIGITSATARFTRDRIPEIANTICQTARNLSSELQL